MGGAATGTFGPWRGEALGATELRRVRPSDAGWPDDATRLSYPDWIVDQLRTDLGDDDAVAALEAMDERAVATLRADGYVQDLGSQWVAQAVGAQVGERARERVQVQVQVRAGRRQTRTRC